jgi:hypothetical protein
VLSVAVDHDRLHVSAADGSTTPITVVVRDDVRSLSAGRSVDFRLAAGRRHRRGPRP